MILLLKVLRETDMVRVKAKALWRSTCFVLALTPHSSLMYPLLSVGMQPAPLASQFIHSLLRYHNLFNAFSDAGILSFLVSQTGQQHTLSVLQPFFHASLFPAQCFRHFNSFAKNLPIVCFEVCLRAEVGCLF